MFVCCPLHCTPSTHTQIQMLKQNPQYDGFRKWGLWELIVLSSFQEKINKQMTKQNKNQKRFPQNTDNADFVSWPREILNN